MNISTVINCWKRAFSLFSKKELPLFVFGWLKTFKSSLIVFIRYFWWLVIAEIGLKFKFFSLPCQNNLFYQITIGIFVILAAMFSIYFSLLSIRASIETKNISYFSSNLKNIFSFMVVYGTIIFLMHTLIAINTGVSNNHWVLSSALYGINLLFQILGAIFLLISGFFLLDNPSIIIAVKNSFKSIIAYLPSFFILAAIYMAFYSILTFIFSFFHYTANITGTLLLNFFFTNALAILYLKIKHSNYKLFFNA